MGRSPRDTHGPIVKTGPTAGKNRSRTKDGTWRKKRSDAGKQKKSRPCFITTAACAHKQKPDDCRELRLLRHLRDHHLMRSETGRNKVDAYYQIAPKIIESVSGPLDWDYVWSVVAKCADEIEAGRSAEAILLYEEMLLALEAKLI